MKIHTSKQIVEELRKQGDEISLQAADLIEELEKRVKPRPFWKPIYRFPGRE